jgi:hypothetical protein
MGWDGTEVTPQIRSLIEDHHLGSIILTAKNLKCKPFSYSLPSKLNSNLLKLLSKPLNWFKNCRPLQRTPVICSLYSSPSTKRMEVLIVFLMKTTSANSLAPWELQLLAGPI